MDNGNRFAIGVDVSDRTASVCVMDHCSGIVDEFVVLLEEAALRRRVPHVPPEQGAVVLETGPRSAWLKRVFESLDFRVIVADARKLAAVSNSPKKTDRNDARMLAQLGLADEVIAAMGSPQRLLSDTYVRPEADQRVYDLLLARDLLVRRRGDFTRLVRSMVKGAGTLLKGGVSRENVPNELMPVLSPLLDAITGCDTAIREYDRMLEPMAKAHPIASRFLPISGVGPITALAFAVVIGDPTRFAKVRDVGAYLGLVVRRDQSGKMDPSLGISKAGNGFVRRLLVQCATQILGPRGKPSELRDWGLAFVERRGKRANKKARIAIARKLAVRMLSIWKNDQTWLPFPNGGASHETTPSATDGGADCGVPPDAQEELAPREIAAAPTDPTQPCARPTGMRTDESAESRRTSRAAPPPPSRTRATNAARVGRQAPATPSALAPRACAGDPADACPSTRGRVKSPKGGLNEVQPPADHEPKKKGTRVDRRRVDGPAAS